MSFPGLKFCHGFLGSVLLTRSCPPVGLSGCIWSAPSPTVPRAFPPVLPSPGMLFPHILPELAPCHPAAGIFLKVAFPDRLVPLTYITRIYFLHRT